MRRATRITALATAAIATAATATAVLAPNASAAPSSDFCTNAANYTIPLGSLGNLLLGGQLLSGPAKYTTISVCFDGQLVKASVLSVNSLASGYLTIDIPPAAPVVIPIPLPL